uniref:Uncharacterized protein n=1 Tax=Oryza barthii TaxID=65489 RepID=A0A0D3H1Y9_9ORYZ
MGLFKAGSIMVHEFLLDLPKTQENITAQGSTSWKSQEKEVPEGEDDNKADDAQSEDGLEEDTLPRGKRIWRRNKKYTGPDWAVVEENEKKRVEAEARTRADLAELKRVVEAGLPQVERRVDDLSSVLGSLSTKVEHLEGTVQKQDGRAKKPVEAKEEQLTPPPFQSPFQIQVSAATPIGSLHSNA